MVDHGLPATHVDELGISDNAPEVAGKNNNVFLSVFNVSDKKDLVESYFAVLWHRHRLKDPSVLHRTLLAVPRTPC